MAVRRKRRDFAAFPGDLNYGGVYFRLSSSGSLAKFAAMRASSRVNSLAAERPTGLVLKIEIGRADVAGSQSGIVLHIK